MGIRFWWISTFSLSHESRVASRESTPVARRLAHMPLLFSYGTLQEGAIQEIAFGRLLQGERDELIGFEQRPFRIDDPAFVALSGKANHVIVTFTGRPESRVPGTVFEITDSELVMADDYEPEGYCRVSARLASGKEAWVYVASAHGSQSS